MPTPISVCSFGSGTDKFSYGSSQGYQTPISMRTALRKFRLPRASSWKIMKGGGVTDHGAFFVECVHLALQEIKEATKVTGLVKNSFYFWIAGIDLTSSSEHATSLTFDNA